MHLIFHLQTIWQMELANLKRYASAYPTLDIPLWIPRMLFDPDPPIHIHQI